MSRALRQAGAGYTPAVRNACFLPRWSRLAALALAPAIVLAVVPPAGATVPRAVQRAGPRTLGALFLHALSSPHTCTASVVRSVGHDLVLTAAHCVAGSGQGIRFVPGYSGGSMPYGAWTVRRAYVDAAWLTARDPRHDYAILTLDKQSRDGVRVGVQDVTGGRRVAGAPPVGVTLAVDAYPAGRDDVPITCRSRVRWTGVYPTFDCAGYVGGTSGGTWLYRPHPRSTPVVVGVVGGLHAGGCSPDVSYTSPFGASMAGLLRRAEAAGPGDVVPAAGPDGC